MAVVPCGGQSVFDPVMSPFGVCKDMDWRTRATIPLRWNSGVRYALRVRPRSQLRLLLAIPELNGHRRRSLYSAIMLLALLSSVGSVSALDIVGVQPAALDQSRVNVLLRAPGPPIGAPLTGTDSLGDETFNIQAFFDTGASGVVLSEETADLLSVQRSPGVLFEDIGICGVCAVPCFGAAPR
jgi:hypothetical protein